MSTYARYACGQCAYVRKFYNDPTRYCSQACAAKDDQ